MTLNVTIGAAYWIAIDGFDGGDFFLSAHGDLRQPTNPIPFLPPTTPRPAPVAAKPKKRCKQGFKRKRGKCVKKKRKA